MLQEYKKIIEFQMIRYDMMHIRYLGLYDLQKTARWNDQ